MNAKLAALSAIGGLVVAIGATLAVSDVSMGDAKSSLAAGDEVMALLPDGAGYSWQGPFTIAERKTYNDLTLQVAESEAAQPVSLSYVEPVQMFEARNRAKGEKR